MKITNIGGFKTINEFVAHKLQCLDSNEKSFTTLFRLMFSEKENVMFEYSEGYKLHKLTYGQCYQNVLKLSEIISQKNPVSEKTTAGIYMNNSAEWIEVFWALLLSGYNPLLLNMRLDDETIESVLEKTEAAFVISDGKNFNCKTINISELTEEMQTVEVQADDSFRNAKTGTEVMLMSSGTSQNVKICSYTAVEFSSLIKDSYKIIKESALIKKHYEGELKLLTFLPFYHIFGFVAVYLWFGFFSRTFVLLKDFAPDTIINTIRRHKVTHIFAVPLFWNKVYEQAIRTIKERGDKVWKKFQKGMKLTLIPVIGKLVTKFAFKEIRDNLFGESISFLIAGGSAISKEVLQFFNGAGYNLSNGYGMTEIGITSVELSTDIKQLVSASVGAPMSSVKYKISENGELLVKGESLANSVWDESGKHSIKENWFNTKDLAEEKNGKYFILGRKDDLIVSVSGENLNPVIIESKFNIEGIQDCCLTEITSEGKKQIVLIVSVPRFMRAERLQQLYEACSAKIQEIKLSGEISRIIFVSQPLITGDEFKVNRKRIRNELESGQLAVIDFNKLNEKSQEYGELDELEQRLVDYFSIALNKSAADIAVNGDFFLDYGGSSLDYFAMTAQLQQEFNIAFPANEEKGMKTVKEIADFIRNSL